jgi:hypothetical protein
LDAPVSFAGRVAGYTKEQIEHAVRRAVLPGPAGMPYNDTLKPSDLLQLWNAANPDEQKQMLPGLKYRASHLRVSKTSKADAEGERDYSRRRC